MTEHNISLVDTYTSNRQRRCPLCAAVSPLTHSFLDPRRGARVHVYQCVACNARVWDDGSRLLARPQ